MKTRTLQLSLIAILSAPVLAWATGGHDMSNMGASHDMPELEDTTTGHPGDPAKVTRTVQVEMNDAMSFTPAGIPVKAGETIRFSIINKGKIAHEMVIGTKEELDEHAAMMRTMPGMRHAEPNQVRLEAGQRGIIVWTFDKAGTFDYACLVPGHREAGMVGKLIVRK